MLTAVQRARVWRTWDAPSGVGWVVRGQVDGRFATVAESAAIDDLVRQGMARLGESRVALLLTDDGVAAMAAHRTEESGTRVTAR